MKLLKNYKFAIVVMVLAIAASAAIGWARQPSVTAQSPSYGQNSATHSSSGQTDRSYVSDGAGVFSADEIAKMDSINADLESRYGVKIGVLTVQSADGTLKSLAQSTGTSWGLGTSDMILVLDIGGADYWLEYGSGITDSALDEYPWTYLEDGFAAGNYGSGVLKLMDALSSWYADNA